MKNHLLKVVALTVLFAGLLPVSHAHEQKFGLVDFTKCQEHHYKTHEKQEEFKQKREADLAPIKKMQDQLKELVDMQRSAQRDLQDPMFSEARKKEILREAQERQARVVSLQREMMEEEAKLQKKLDQMASGIQKKLTDEILKVIDEISKEKGLHLVLNKTFGINGVPTFAHTDDSVMEDITDAVIAKLNSTAPEGYTVPKNEEEPAG